MSVTPTLQALRFLLIIVEMLEIYVSFQTNYLSNISISAHFFSLQGSLFIFMEKKKIIYIQSSACLRTAKSHVDWMSTAQFTAFLSISREVKEEDNSAYLSLVAQLQQLVVRQHHLSSCADIFQLHILKLKF